MFAISSGNLIQLCHRVGSSLRAGIDVRRIWEQEARFGSPWHKQQVEGVRRAVAVGDSVAEAMRNSGGYFPPLFCQMVEIGEKTGKLDEILLQLAQYYEHQRQLKWQFIRGVAWPMLELVASVLVIAGVIWITGLLNDRPGAPAVDITGLGLSGGWGAITFLTIVGGFFAALGGALYALARGWLGPAPIFFAMRIPILGPCLEALALARLTWSFAYALDAGMGAEQSTDLAIAATSNGYYLSQKETVLRKISGGATFHEAFSAAKVFPEDFLHNLESAEIAGATTEQLLRLARLYDDQATQSLKTLTTIATVVTMMFVFGVIIFAIFKMAMFYIGSINDALNGF